MKHKSIVSFLLLSLMWFCNVQNGFAASELSNISGTVYDENGEPLIGASVHVSGTNIGTATDLEGKFSLANIQKGAVLQFSYVGYQNQSVKFTGTPLKIVLKATSNSLDEIVVVGYGTMKKRDLSGSVSSVKSDELNTVAQSSVSQMLQGKVAGLSAVQSSAQPGAGIKVTIRGAASPSGNNSPLYVIDGVPIQTNTTADPGISTPGYDLKTGVDRDPLNSINPSDIETIEVLKDASAAAIYGASAANGVVLITTKNGKSGKPKVEWRSVFTAQIKKDYPEVLDGKSFREAVNFWTKEYYLYNNGMGVYGDNPTDLSGYVPIFSESQLKDVINTNWMDEVSRNGYVIDQNLSVNGGTDKTKYYFSYNYYNNRGMLQQSGLIRNSIRLNLDQEFSSRLNGSIKMNYSNIKVNSTSVGAKGNGDNMISNALVYAPDVPVKDENGNYSHSYNTIINNPVSFTEIEDKTVTDRLFISPSLDFKIMDGLNIRAVGGYDMQSTSRNFYLPSSAQNVTATKGLASIGYTKIQNLSGEVFMNFNRTFGDIHRVSAVLGVGYYKTINQWNSMGAYDFYTDSFGYNNIGVASDKDKQTLNSSRTERTKLSQFLRLNYTLLDRYILAFTLRRDGSSYFAKNNKWGVFPSVSAAWRIKEESFLRDVNPLSDLKIRVGYGATGNENVLGSNSLTLYKGGYNHLIGNSMHTGFILNQIENPNLKWETDYTLNAGIDFGFLNQRISGSFEYYHRGVKNLLDFQKLPSTNPVASVAANIGETKSEGVELSLRSVNITNHEFNWMSDLNVSYFKATWVKRNPAVEIADYIGYNDELDAIYGWKTDGIITSSDQIPSYMPDAKIGNVKYVDINGDGILDSKDVVKLGTYTPKWNIGFGNTFSYKGFDLNIYFYCALDFQKWRGALPDAHTLGSSGTAPGNTFVSINEVWNSQTGGNLPGIASNIYDSQNPTGSSDFYLMKGDYIKLKNITLGYSLPKKLFHPGFFLRGARFFIDAQNLATWTKYKGFDPELAVDNPYPQAVSLSFGFNLEF